MFSNVSRRRFLLTGMTGILSTSVVSRLKAQTANAVRVAYHPAYTRFHAMHVAEVVQKQGLAPNWVKFTTGTATIYAFQAGGVDAGVLGIPPILGGLASGQDLKIIAIDSDYSSGEGLVARADKQIRTIEDIRGKKVGTIKGTSAHFSFAMALNKAGIKADELTTVFLDGTTIVPAFTSGDVDAVWIFQPFWYMLADKGGQHVITDKQLGIPAIGLWIARGEWLAARSDDCIKFLLAFEEGEKAKRDHRQEVINRLQSTIGLSPEIAERLYTSDTLVSLKDQVQPDHPLSLTAGPAKGLGAFLDSMGSFLAEQKILASAPNLSQAIASDYAVQAAKRMYG